MGTPLLTRVPSVRVKREMATLLTTGPMTGTLSLNLSKTRRPNLVRMNIMRRTTRPATQPNVTMKWSLIMSLIPSTSRVKAGSCSPFNMSAKTSLNLGITNTIRMVRITVATTSTATG